jgi:hypothetical protein
MEIFCKCSKLESRMLANQRSIDQEAIEVGFRQRKQTKVVTAK